MKIERRHNEHNKAHAEKEEEEEKDDDDDDEAVNRRKCDQKWNRNRKKTNTTNKRNTQHLIRAYSNL